jgi:hypothetical protein
VFSQNCCLIGYYTPLNIWKIDPWQEEEVFPEKERHVSFWRKHLDRIVYGKPHQTTIEVGK